MNYGVLLSIITLKRNIEMWRTDYVPTNLKLLNGLNPILYQNGMNCKQEKIQTTHLFSNVFFGNIANLINGVFLDE